MASCHSFRLSSLLPSPSPSPLPAPSPSPQVEHPGTYQIVRTVIERTANVLQTPIKDYFNPYLLGSALCVPCAQPRGGSDGESTAREKRVEVTQTCRAHLVGATWKGGGGGGASAG